LTYCLDFEPLSKPESLQSKSPNGQDGSVIVPVKEATVVPVPSPGPPRRITLPDIETREEDEISAVDLAPAYSVTPSELPTPVSEPKIILTTIERRGLHYILLKYNLSICIQL